MIHVDGDLNVSPASETDEMAGWYEYGGVDSFPERTISTLASGAYSVFATGVDGDDVDALSALYADVGAAGYDDVSSARAEVARPGPGTPGMEGR